jgi:16S rRNA (cytosine967-C5)-methyltransferase
VTPPRSQGRPAPGRRPAPATPSPAATARPNADTARGLALRALRELEETGGRANVIVPGLLAGTALAERDRAFVTELVYGTARMRRACDWLVDRHLRRPVEPQVRAALRLGAYQLAMLGTPAHAGVSATVAEVSGPARGLVNAVLRRVAEDVASGLDWPSDAVRLSYPDWVVAELTAALGSDVTMAALQQMNVPAFATLRADGYVQDQASQWAAQAVMAGLVPGERIADLCAAPGGKATWLAHGDQTAVPALVVAGDLDSQRAAVIAENVTRIGLDNVATVVLDGLRPPFPPSTFDRVLVDAPCSGLGVLRRRPDARWRIQPDDVARLAGLQRRLLDQALTLVRPGGLVVYSVCTLTEAETTEIDRWAQSVHPEAEAVAPAVGDAWEGVGRGARLVPQAAGTDGMYLLALRWMGPPGGG